VHPAWETFVERDPAGLDYLAEDLVYEVGGQSVQAGTYEGHEGYLRLMRSWTEVWTEFRLEPREFIDGGEDKVIVVARRSGRSRMTDLRFNDDVFFGRPAAAEGFFIPWPLSETVSLRNTEASCGK
jgi:ketosteroid isomerase-like protein